MKFAVVAHRRSATNEALVAAARAWGLDSELLDPHTALTSLEPGDVALARLDVREGLDGMERGTGELERLAAGGADVRNPPGTLIVAHYKLLTVAGEGVVPRARRARARAGGAERLGYAARGGRRECRRCCVPDRQKRRVATNAALGAQVEPVEPSPIARALALAAAQAARADLVGVDLLPTPNGGFLILELNGAVDFRPVYAPLRDVFFDAVAALLEDGVPRPELAVASV